MPPFQEISRVCSPAGMSLANRSVAVSDSMFMTFFSSVFFPSIVAATMSSSRAWRVISRDDRAVRSAIRSQPVEVHVSNSSSNRIS